MTLLFILLTLNTAAAFASEAPRPADFAYGFTLQTEGEGPIYRLALPEAVYRSVTRPDLGDIRVFDRDGHIAPHTLRSPPSGSTGEAKTLDLPYFPVFGDAGRDWNSGELTVHLDAKGGILDLRTGGKDIQAERVSAYLLDATRLDEAIDELALNWSGADGPFLANICIETSDDLRLWNSVRCDGVLADLRQDGHELKRNTVALPSVRAKYLRFTWPPSAQGATLTRARVQLQAPYIEQARRWTRAQGRFASSTPLAYEFDSGGLFPVDRVRVVRAQRNALIEATLKSRPAPDAPWQLRYRGLFYDLEVYGQQLKSEPIKSTVTTDRYWRLEPMGEAVGLPADLSPALEFGWIPNEIVFLARGTPPFRLAFGNARMRAAAQPVDALLRQFSEERQAAMTGPARIGDQVELGGTKVLMPGLEDLPWQRLLLWGLLIGGVLLLVWMAVHVYRQVNRTSD